METKQILKELELINEFLLAQEWLSAATSIDEAMEHIRQLEDQIADLNSSLRQYLTNIKE